MKKLLLFLPLLLLLFAAGCVSAPPKKVGICVVTLEGSYLQELSYEIRRELDQRGYETVIRDAKMNDALQIKQIEEFTQDYQDGKLSALLIMPINSTTILPALEKAQAAGLPIFTISTGLAKNDKVKPISNFGLDDAAAGRIAAKLLMAATKDKPGKVLVIGTSNFETCRERIDGLSDELTASHSPLQLIPLECTAGWQNVAELVFDVLRKDAGTREIVGIFAPMDPVMIDAMTARNLNGRESDVRIVGLGSSGASRNAVSDGLIFGTVEHSIPEMAAVSVQAVCEYLENGTKPAEEILIPVVAFTAADAKAQQLQQQKKAEEEAANLKKIRQEAVEKQLNGKAAPEVKQPESPKAAAEEKTTPPAPAAAAPAAAESGNPAPAKTDVLRDSLDTTKDSAAAEAAPAPALKKNEDPLPELPAAKMEEPKVESSAAGKDLNPVLPESSLILKDETSGTAAPQETTEGK